MGARKTATLKEQAYVSIREAIISKRIRKDMIYSEQWFADHFQISRTPVREALLQLRNDGLIEVLPNRGMVIRNLTMADAEHIFQMRAAIEGYCCSVLARDHKKPEAAAVLDAIEEDMARYLIQYNLTDELGLHIRSIKYTGNPLFMEEFDRMRAQIEVFWWDVIAESSREQEAHDEHLRILRCMRAGDAAGAYSASVEHSQITLQRIRERNSFDAPSERKLAERFPEHGQGL